MILVTGATGNVGSELCRILAESGEPVRGLIRDDSRRARLAAGVEGVVGDLNDPDSLAPALDGVRGVHLLAGYAGLPAALERMKAAGVERVTLQSSSAVPDGDTTNAVARYHIESEAAIRASRLAWTFLQPNGFMSNALEWAEPLRRGDVVTAPFAGVRPPPIDPRGLGPGGGGGAPAPFAGVRTAQIDPRDIAAVGAVVLTSGGLDSRSLRLSGPESLLAA